MSHETADFRYEGTSTKSLVDVFGSSIETKRWSFRKKKQIDRVAFVFSGGGNKGACQVGSFANAAALSDPTEHPTTISGINPFLMSPSSIPT